MKNMKDKVVCPNCKSNMSKKDINGTEIDECPDCKGIFLDFGEIKDLINYNIKKEKGKEFNEVKLGNFKLLHEETPLVCPKCSELMEERQYIYGSGNMINFCTGCGSIYLDGGILENIKDYELSKNNNKEAQKLMRDMEVKSRLLSKEQENKIKEIEGEEKKISKIYNKAMGMFYNMFK